MKERLCRISFSRSASGADGKFGPVKWWFSDALSLSSVLAPRTRLEGRSAILLRNKPLLPARMGLAPRKLICASVSALGGGGGAGLEGGGLVAESAVCFWHPVRDAINTSTRATGSFRNISLGFFSRTLLGKQTEFQLHEKDSVTRWLICERGAGRMPGLFDS